MVNILEEKAEEGNVKVPELESEFVKGLGLFDSTMIVAGSMIGSGIFLVSADISRQVGSAWLLLLVWVLAGFMTIVGALSFGELAASMPKVGGVYVFLKEAWNELIGFAYGWTFLLVIQTGTIAAVAVATAKFMAVLFPFLSSPETFINLGPVHFLTMQQILAIVTLFSLTAINMTGIRSGAIVQNVFTVAKVIALLGLIVLGLWFVHGEGRLVESFSEVSAVSSDNYLFGILSLIAIASVGALFSADAWFDITFVAGEVKNPSRNLPLALLFGTGMVIGLYLLANLAYLNVLGFENIKMAHEDRVATAAMNAIFGHTGEMIMAVVILISTIGCNNGLILSGARVLYAMSRDSLFFKQVSEIHPKYHTPAVALVIQCIWASIICLSGQYSQILDYVICAGLIFYILAILGVFRLRMKRPDMPRPYKVIGYPFLPAVYILFATFIIVNLLLYKPMYCWPGMIIVLSALPVYFIWKKLNKKEVPDG